MQTAETYYGVQQLRVEKAVGSQILLATGILVDPFDLQDDDIDLWAMCWSAGQLNRYTGHCRFPYSVAQHSVLLASVVPDHLRRAALAHDLSEPLCNDIPRPLKRKLPEFVSFETEVQKRLFAHWNIPWEHMLELNVWDTNICTDEMAQLMNYDTGRPAVGVTIEQMSWEDARDALYAACLENNIV